MDILLAHAYVLNDDPHERQVMKPYPPLGVLSLSAYLKRQGFGVAVFDATFQSLDDFPAALAREKPSVVGIYVNLMTKFNALKLAKVAKESGAWVVLGGPEPPYYAADYLRAGADVIVIGEGEHTLEELTASLIKNGRRELHSINGIAFLDDDGQLVETDAREMIKDLSSLPWPDRDSIDIRAYLNTWKTHHGTASMSVIHARGCPYTCKWCSHSVYGNTHRRRSPEHAADEILYLKEVYNPDLIWYADDVFAMNHKWLRAYADALKVRGIKIPFECISRADRLTEPVIELLAEMGCFRLWNGSESGSQRIIDAMDRKVDVADVRAKTHLLQKYGIQAGMFIMLGYTGETIQDIIETTEHLKIANPDIFLTTVAYPIKGTAFYTEVESSILTDKPWDARTDRDLTVAGRYSRRFYSFATRWMVSSVALHRARTHGGVSLKRQAKLAFNVAVGRVGMALTQNGRES